MTALPTRHWWLDATAQTTDGRAAARRRSARALPPPVTRPVHRRALPPPPDRSQLVERDAELVAAARALEVESIAPELMAIVPTPPQTLTNLSPRPGNAPGFYPAARALRIARRGRTPRGLGRGGPRRASPSPSGPRRRRPHRPRPGRGAAAALRPREY